MESYRVLIKTSAARELEGLSNAKTRRLVVARIRALADDPRPVECEKLAGRDGRYRVRQGAYRVICSVSDEGRTVLVVKIGHQRDIYR